MNRVGAAVVVVVVVLVDLALHAPEPLPIAPLQERIGRRRGDHRRRGSGLRRVSGCPEQSTVTAAEYSSRSFSIVVAGAVIIGIGSSIILLHHLSFFFGHT